MYKQSFTLSQITTLANQHKHRDVCLYICINNAYAYYIQNM